MRKYARKGLKPEIELRGTPFSSKTQLTVHYKDRPLRVKFIPDLIVFGELLVEVKAVKTLAPEHEAQRLNYLEISKKAVGI